MSLFTKTNFNFQSNQLFKPQTRAGEVVRSLLPTKASLKSRFGDAALQVEVDVQEEKNLFLYSR